jgi:hypothetical protein
VGDEWLFKTPKTRAQDIRIRSLLENESVNEKDSLASITIHPSSIAQHLFYFIWKNEVTRPSIPRDLTSRIRDYRWAAPQLGCLA